MAERYIFDTNVLIQYPEVLSRAGGNKLVIPEAVIEELKPIAHARDARHGLMAVINKAIAKGIKITPSPVYIKQELPLSDIAAQRLTGADIAIASIAIQYAERMGAKEVKVVSADRLLAEYLSSRGISTISGTQFLSEPFTEKADENIAVSARKYTAAQKRYQVISFVLGIVASLLGDYAFSNFQYLVHMVSVWGTLIVLPLLGVALFLYRERFRLSYGVFEFFVGVIITYYVFFPSFNYSKLGVVEAIQILGGLYVMVRGLDNVGKGVEGTRFELYWKKIFE